MSLFAAKNDESGPVTRPDTFDHVIVDAGPKVRFILAESAIVTDTESLVRSVVPYVNAFTAYTLPLAFRNWGVAEIRYCPSGRDALNVPLL